MSYKSTFYEQWFSRYHVLTELGSKMFLSQKRPNDSFLTRILYRTLIGKWVFWLIQPFSPQNQPFSGIFRNVPKAKTEPRIIPQRYPMRNYSFLKLPDGSGYFPVLCVVSENIQKVKSIYNFN